jgi:S-DNA-T family DNA segregation ATPase FtsK/SpoIIIE
MHETQISVSQLKWACLDESWLQSWLRGENPPTQHFATHAAAPVSGTLFHSTLQQFSEHLIRSGPQAVGQESEDALWSEMFYGFAEGKVEELIRADKLPAAQFFSDALRFFCYRLHALRRDLPNFTRWSDIIFSQEHPVPRYGFSHCQQTVLISGIIDAVRLHPNNEIEIVDYKLSKGANVQHDLVQLAIYGWLLEATQPGVRFRGCLEYYMPACEVLEVSAAQLREIFRDFVEPTLRRICETLAAKSAAATPMAVRIKEVFASFKLEVDVTEGASAPQLTRYVLKPGRGVTIVSLVNRADDLQGPLGLASKPRIEPSAVGLILYVPKSPRDSVLWWDCVGACKKSAVSFPVGVSVDNALVEADLTDPKTCHALVGGSAGSGKSEVLRTLVATLIHRNSPEKVRLALVDPKIVSFSGAEGLPHLLLPVLTEMKAVIKFLAEAVDEMERRYQILASEGFLNLNSRHEAGKGGIPFWVIVFDEFSDLVLSGADEKRLFETRVSRLASKGRAAGIHLVLATQRPDRQVVTGQVKANLPMRICLKVADGVNSKIILDQGGGEKLMGRGDLLYMEGSPPPLRVQGCYITPKEWTALMSEKARK